MEPSTKLAVGLQSSPPVRWACPQDFSEAFQAERAQAERSSAVACRSGNSRTTTAPAVLLGAMIDRRQQITFRPNSHGDSAAVSCCEFSPAGRTRWRDGRRVSDSLFYRVWLPLNDVTGSGDMYDTLVNMQTGPRILDQTLTMQSVDHQGQPFDNLYLNSVGWGGDPNNYMRLRADKDKWYNLQGSFRRDQSFFDYDLLANPLNPPTSTPSIPILNSPHLFDTTRRMSDVDLTLLPQSRVSFRVGYSHNNMTGPS